MLQKLNEIQNKTYIDAVQIYDAYRDAYKAAFSYRGGMTWKKAKGKEYLFKIQDRFGNGKSLGARSAETEEIFEAFHSNKKKITKRFQQLTAKVKEQAMFCKAAKIQRVPTITAKTLRELDQQNLLGNHMIIVGTNALYSYESAAGAYFENKLLSTGDIDILWDIRSKLTLAIDENSNPYDFIDVLRKVDKSFEIYGKQTFRVANNDGYMVDLLKAMPSRVIIKERDRIGGPNDLIAVEVKNLSWLLSSPKFDQVVIGLDGIPARIVTPDPRAFALHKFWVGNQKDRDPKKKDRDIAQAIAVTQLILDHLPQLRFTEDQMQMFPPELLKKFQITLDKEEERFPSMRF